MTTERVALDQSGTLRSLYDTSCDIVRGQIIDDFETSFTVVKEPTTCLLLRGRTAESQNLLQSIGIDDELRLSIYLKMVTPNGIASIINYPEVFNEDTRFLYFHYKSYMESCSNNSKLPSRKIPSKPLATHIITEISWGITAIVVLQLPSRCKDKYENLLNKICESLIYDKRPKEMDSNEIELYKQIISVTVYSNINELTKLTKLEDTYRKLMQLKKFRNEHQQLNYTLSPIGALYPESDEEGYKLYGIEPSIIDTLELYLLQQFNEVKRLHIRLNRDLPKLIQGQLRSANEESSNINKLYQEKLQAICTLIINIRKNIDTQTSIEELVHLYDQPTMKDSIQNMIRILDTLETKGKFIEELQNEGFEYCNVVKLGIEKHYSKQLIEQILRANYTHQAIIITTDELRLNNKESWNRNYTELLEQRRNDSNLQLVYADFTYSTYKLRKIKRLILEETIAKNEQLNSTLSETNQVNGAPLLPPSNDEYINILLLGESGVGKSTFVNAFANYLRFQSFEKAQRAEPIVIIPTSFVMTVNDNFDERIIKLGEPDLNENHNDSGQSVTQQCKSYVFSISNEKKLRIIDTPGFGDTRGVDQDDLNMNEVFSFLNNFTYLNGICLLFKPEVAQLNPYFRSCCSQLFDYFGENIRNHLIFCFTNARSTFFAPGSTRPLLMAFFESFPVKNIPFAKANTFCFDSESFRYLVALQNSITFDKNDRKEFEESWSRSVMESKRFRDYLINQSSYRRNIEWQSIKDVQFQISYMIRPLLEATRHLLRNIILYERNSSLQLSAKAARSPSVICYSCNRKNPKKIGRIWILQDHLHRSSNTCDSNEQKATEYQVDYNLVNEPITKSLDDLNNQFKHIYKICAELFYFLLVNASTAQDDPFQTGFNRMIDEEEFICETQTSTNRNQILIGKLNELKTKYEKYLKKLPSNKGDLSLTNAYDLIKEVNEIPMVKVQLDVIKDYHQHLIEENQKQI